MDEEDSFALKPPRPKNWAELFSITGGLVDISMAEIESGRLDWSYDFSREGLRKCGRRNCKREHGKGWLVALRGGRFIHIGHICAAKYAENKAAWSAKETAYNEERKAEARRHAAVQAHAAAKAALDWLDTSRDLAMAKKLTASFFEAARGPFLDALRARAEKLDTLITTERERTPEEIAASRTESIDSHGQRRISQLGRFEVVTLGAISGLAVMRALRDPSELERRLRLHARKLAECDVSKMDGKEIKDLHASIREIGPQRAALEESINNSLRFFRPSNLALIMRTKEARAQGMKEVLVGPDGTAVIRRRDGWQ